MTKSLLPPDDLPPLETMQADKVLNRQLEDSLSKHFYETCDGVTQALLLSCEWYLTLKSGELNLVIDCPTMSLNWRVLNNMVLIGNALEHFAQSAKIRICPPEGMGLPFELRVDEISVYRDLFN